MDLCHVGADPGVAGGGRNFFDRLVTLIGQLGGIHWIVLAIGLAAILLITPRAARAGWVLALGVSIGPMLRELATDAWWIEAVYD